QGGAGADGTRRAPACDDRTRRGRCQGGEMWRGIFDSARNRGGGRAQRVQPGPARLSATVDQEANMTEPHGSAPRVVGGQVSPGEPTTAPSRGVPGLPRAHETGTAGAMPDAEAGTAAADVSRETSRDFDTPIGAAAERAM